MKDLTFLAFLFSLGKGKSETEHIPTGQQQNMEGNWPEAPFQCSAVRIQHHCLISDVQPQKSAEGIRLPSNWLKVACLNLSKFIFLLGFFFVIWAPVDSSWANTLLSIGICFPFPLQQWRLWAGLSWEERIHLAQGPKGNWQQKTSLLSCSLYVLAATKSPYKARYYHSLGEWVWSGLCTQLSEGTTGYKYKVGELHVGRLVLAMFWMVEIHILLGSGKKYKTLLLLFFLHFLYVLITPPVRNKICKLTTEKFDVSFPKS